MPTLIPSRDPQGLVCQEPIHAHHDVGRREFETFLGVLELFGDVLEVVLLVRLFCEEGLRLADLAWDVHIYCRIQIHFAFLFPTNAKEHRLRYSNTDKQRMKGGWRK
jgi:hypothetical protein